jgi:hypothetical protein
MRGDAESLSLDWPHAPSRSFLSPLVAVADSKDRRCQPMQHPTPHQNCLGWMSSMERLLRWNCLPYRHRSFQWALAKKTMEPIQLAFPRRSY